MKRDQIEGQERKETTGSQLSSAYYIQSPGRVETNKSRDLIQINILTPCEDDDVGERPGDSGNWLSSKAGNRVARCTATPGERTFGGYMLKRIFAL